MFRTQSVRQVLTHFGLMAPALVLMSGCGEKELPVVSDAPPPAASAGAEGATGAPAADADPIGSAIQSADPSLPPGRKE